MLGDMLHLAKNILRRPGYLWLPREGMAGVDLRVGVVLPVFIGVFVIFGRVDFANAPYFLLRLRDSVLCF